MILGSRALVASSHSRTFGSVVSALAMATLCFCPPDSWLGQASALSSRPTILSISSARERCSFLSYLAIFIGIITFCITVFCDRRLKCWNIIAICCLACLSSFWLRLPSALPSKRTSPLLTSSRRFSVLTSVLFPAPLIPIMPNISPLRISRSILSRAFTLPLFPEKILETFFSSNMLF